MAFNSEEQKRLVQAYRRSAGAAREEAQIANLLDLLLRPRSEQIAAMRSWLTNHKTALTESRSRIDTDASRSKADLETEIAAADELLEKPELGERS